MSAGRRRIYPEDEYLINRLLSTPHHPPTLRTAIPDSSTRSFIIWCVLVPLYLACQLIFLAIGCCLFIFTLETYYPDHVDEFFYEPAAQPNEQQGNNP